MKIHCDEFDKKLVDETINSITDETGRISIDPNTVEADLARLILSLMELVRQILEAQAIRRIENGTITEDEEERVGLTLMKAENMILKLASDFGVPAEDLDIGLGSFEPLVR